MVSTLFVPYRDGLVKLDSAGANPRDGWIKAELARGAVRLLEDWQAADNGRTGELAT